MIVHSTLYHDTRREKKDGNYPVKVRITHERVQKYYQTGISLTIDDWNTIQANKAKKDLKTIGETLEAMKVKARSIIDKMEYFDFKLFKIKFYQKRSTKGALVVTFIEYISELKAQKRIGTAISYDAALKSLQQYKPNIDFKDITPSFLHNYEEWMISNGRSSTTIGMYLRALRSIFNIAIANGQLLQDLYPFGKRKYQIPTGRNIKKALTKVEIEKIYTYQANNEAMQKAKDFWLFSYLCQGINPKDIALLKHKNIIGDDIHFQRAKTQNSTKANPIVIRICISKPSKEIIDRWQNNDNSPDNYLFPILKKGMTAEEEYATIQQFTKTINKYIDRIAKEVGISKKVRTYTARHSYSTILKTEGASIEFIAESLGHTDIKTTQNYLDSFDNDTKRLWSEKLIEF